MTELCHLQSIIQHPRASSILQKFTPATGKAVMNCFINHERCQWVFESNLQIFLGPGAIIIDC
eukprot:scaffold69221_cov16-Prasinocladus_malaysianus.AAC.1